MAIIVAEVQACVVGAGVMGLSAACHLAARGIPAMVLERGTAGQEASAANAGTLGLQNKPIAALPLVLAAVQRWRGLSEELGFDVQYERRGGFRLAHSAADVETLERAVAAQRAEGLAVDLLYQPDLARAAPYLAPGVLAASYCDDDGMANPLATTRALLRGCRQWKVPIWTQCGVTALEIRGDRDFLLHTPRGLVRAQYVVSAAGAWSADVARLAGVSLPLTSEVLQVLTTTMTAPIFPHIICHVRGNLTAKQSAVTGKILIGGAWPGDGDRERGTKSVRRDSVIGNLRWVVENIPAIAQTRLQRAWVGFEGRSPDKLLAAGPLERVPGFYVIGCASGGFTVAPMAGLLAARYVAGEPPDALAARYDLRRFGAMPAIATPHAEARA